MKKLTLSIALNVLFILFFIGKRIYYSCGFAKPPKENIDWLAIAEEKNREKTTQFASYPISAKDVVFVGSSLTEGFPVTEYFEHAKNRGIGGNTILHVTNRIGQVTTGKPKQLFLEIGINDINIGMALDSIKIQYLQLVELIRQQSPTTELFIQSLLPTNKEFAKEIPRIMELNRRIEGISKAVGATYIDLYHAFLKNGVLNEDYTRDGLHLNIKGYEVWRDQISEYVNKSTLYTTK